MTDDPDSTVAPASAAEPLLHVVLYQPEIPPNTGNIGRTCLAVGAKLWLIRPLGFLLDEPNLRRAGMDYWRHLNWEAVDTWEEVLARLPGQIRDAQPQQNLKLPMHPQVRSLNLASTANTVVYEAVRQFGGLRTE